jgi:hypothetical protein
MTRGSLSPFCSKQAQSQTAKVINRLTPGHGRLCSGNANAVVFRAQPCSNACRLSSFKARVVEIIARLLKRRLFSFLTGKDFRKRNEVGHPQCMYDADGVEIVYSLN